MREIKFRVFNGIEMTDNVVVGRFGNFYVNPGGKGEGLNPNDTASLTSHTTKYHENTPVMQFTGLKDKNGKEIYEGDIVKNLLATDPEHLGWTVIWDYVGFKFKCNSLINGEVLIVDKLPNGSIVIGNIYQNPELLK